MLTLSKDEIREHVRRALAEDIGPGDVTTLATVPAESRGKASMVAREPLVVAGLALAEAAFVELSAEIAVEIQVPDGSRARAGEVLLRVRGPTRAILTAERVALNFVQRLSGIATLTAEFVAAVKGTRARILDTRKTTPGWRRLEKYAVSCGGGTNHRTGLHDLVLIKDNHLAALRAEVPNPIAAAVARARAAFPALKVEVEVDRLEQVSQAVEAGADIILLDNMDPEQLRQAVALIDQRAVTEASGCVNLNIVGAMAATGVDFISVGALTHSARAVDIGLDFES
ncbi:MAG: carboxylating nicotinate-nucleotide diphosphorylase [Verrucomicrobia bacterium]|nr:carboxylating nicotinate-nucleotide diphosphorylase [Verrucomicrobiota bacterium]